MADWLTVRISELSAAAASFSFSRTDTCLFRESMVPSCSYRTPEVYSDAASGAYIVMFA